MSAEERTVWITLLTTPLVAAVYLAVMVPRVWSTPAEEISWVVPMIWAFGAIVVAVVVLTIIAMIASEVSAQVGAAVRDAIRGEAAGRTAGHGSLEDAAEAGAAAGVEEATYRRPVEADERDKQIELHGNYRGTLVVAAGVLVAIVLAMLDMDRFWIAHALFGAIVLGSVYSAVVKVLAYRRGI